MAFSTYIHISTTFYLLNFYTVNTYIWGICLGTMCGINQNSQIRAHKVKSKILLYNKQ